MDGFEFAYYLNRRQLLLLLSLIDRRPVAGLPPVEQPTDWREVSLSLLEDGRLLYRDGQLVMNEKISGLLLAIKDARRVCTVHTKGPDLLMQTFYEGERNVLLELLPGGDCRLCSSENGALRHLVQERLFLPNPLPEALLSSLSEDETLQSCLDRWKHREISLEDSSILWLQAEETRGVLDCLTSEYRDRWIWVEDHFTGLILHQDKDGIHAEPDTASRRQAIARELDWEA